MINLMFWLYDWTVDQSDFIYSSMEVDMHTQTILAAVELAVFAALLILGLFKVAKAAMNSRKFLIKFYVCVIVLTTLELALQIYQLITLCQGGQPSVYVLMIINLYSMTMETITIFILGDYWNQTWELITKQSTQQQIEEYHNWARTGVLIFWVVILTAFIGYALATNSFNDQPVFPEVLALGCQGIAVVLDAWAIIVQIIRGHNLSNAVEKYEEGFNTISLHKIQFRCLYWMSTVFNLVRLLFLIAVTLVFVTETTPAAEDWKWLAIYVYTFTNCIIIAIYIFGFSTQPNNKPTPISPSKISTLLEGQPCDEERSNRSRHETELSSSMSDRTH